ncbi:MAG: hypothetical protein R3281_18730 [Balneolaceae bacterium]|nr:hypothetical protein [Balneolaceae bacterium]
MGRALLIICSGVILAVSYIGIGTSEQGQRLATTNAGYAKMVKAKNAAQTAIQLAMNKINEDPTWDDNHSTEGTAWHHSFDDADIQLWVEILSGTSGNLLKVDTLRIISRAQYFGKSAEVVSVYQKSALHYVPKFKSALQFASNQFNFNMNGSATLSGNDASGTCSDIPGIAVNDPNKYNDVDDFESYVSGDPAVTTDTTLSYSPVDELIARLETMNGVTHLSGSYKGDMGTQDNPGVFFVDEPTTLSGGLSDGYGIMVVRTNGELEYEGELDVAGNFTFNGLVIFENAWTFSGSGTPSINGSVLVGNTSNTTDLDVDLTGTIDIQYDCRGQDYAELASAQLLKQNRYKRMTTFE